MEMLSLDLATVLYDLAGWAFIASLVIGVIATCVMFLTGKIKEVHWDKERSASNERIAGLDKETADAKRRQKEAELKLAQMEKRQEPRGVPDDRIANILRTAPPAKVILLYQKGDRDSVLFAGGVKDAIRMGGWEILEFKGVDDINEGGTGQGDMMFWMRSLGNKSESIRMLEVALTEAGFRFGGMSDPDLPDDTLRLKIFTKP